ncbi:hypothetical protein [Xylocopilactobacillus apis]|uniref:Uncharacterized protein n=1 Tax=Xylocopilactobacillus apis TaxID=2932183 RepID=A0AAU9DIA9_9LACO|nr:hypothetical protein [Xylocopilactobacillus apis]BDR56487.1 hypothetical protein KIMC2_10490 [Xylocopilactobacillus apis]
MNKEVESKSKIVNANFFKKNGSKIITFMFVLLILVYAMNMAFKRAAFVDFYAVDGDFQNYDAWRRILHGFVPFRDFSVYLGLGHLYIGALFTLIFGGTFASSLFVGVFLTITLTASIIFVIVKLITKNTNVSLLASTLFVVGYEVYPGVIDYLTKKIFSVSTNYITPGPSARILRGSCVILYFLIVFLIIKKLYFKSFLKFSICTSLFNGFLILFSNDTGISSFVASSLCFLILLIKKYKYDWKKI